MNTHALVAELAGRHRPVKHIAFSRICFEWGAVTAISFFATMFLYYDGFRADLAARILEPLFTAEIALNFVLVVAAGLSATALAYPDRAKSGLLQILLGIAFTGYSVVFLITAFRYPVILDPLAKTTPHGFECLKCILTFAAIPALWIIWRLRQLASVKPALMGMAALLMALANGSLGVRLLESEIMPDGLLLSHYLPLITLSGAGLLLGRKIFRW